MLFGQTKNTHSLQSKISQNKSSKFREMEKRVTFLTLREGGMRVGFQTGIYGFVTLVLVFSFDEVRIKKIANETCSNVNGRKRGQVLFVRSYFKGRKINVIQHLLLTDTVTTREV